MQKSLKGYVFCKMKIVTSHRGGGRGGEGSEPMSTNDTWGRGVYNRPKKFHVFFEWPLSSIFISIISIVNPCSLVWDKLQVKTWSLTLFLFHTPVMQQLHWKEEQLHNRNFEDQVAKAIDYKPRWSYTKLLTKICKIFL